MNRANAANLNTQNIELIKTYYSGARPDGKSFFNHRLLWAAAAGLLLLAIGAGAIYFLFLKGYNTGGRPVEIKTLSPAKQSQGISYYDYNDISSGGLPLMLNRKRSVVALNFTDSKDFSNLALAFAAKGETGGEKIAVIFKDSGNLSNTQPGDIIEIPLPSANKWQAFKINVGSLRLPLNIRRVTQVRFKSMADSAGAAAYIKNITVE